MFLGVLDLFCDRLQTLNEAMAEGEGSNAKEAFLQVVSITVLLEFLLCATSNTIMDDCVYFSTKSTFRDFAFHFMHSLKKEGHPFLCQSRWYLFFHYQAIP